jgi:hypothetical protein
MRPSIACQIRARLIWHVAGTGVGMRGFEPMATRQGKRQFGSIRKLLSGRFRARYTGPDGHMHAARRENGQPLTFETKGDANDWLSLRRSEILRNDWLPPAAPEI